MTADPATSAAVTAADIAETIREAREDAGLSIREAAAVAGLNWHTWKAIETAGQEPTTPSPSLANTIRAARSLNHDIYITPD